MTEKILEGGKSSHMTIGHSSAVAEGKFPNTEAQQKVGFGKVVTARYLRFTALSEVNGQDFASAAELELIP